MGEGPQGDFYPLLAFSSLHPDVNKLLLSHSKASNILVFITAPILRENYATSQDESNSYTVSVEPLMLQSTRRVSDKMLRQEIIGRHFTHKY